MAAYERGGWDQLAQENQRGWEQNLTESAPSRPNVNTPRLTREPHPAIANVCAQVCVTFLEEARRPICVCTAEEWVVVPVFEVHCSWERYVDMRVHCLEHAVKLGLYRVARESGKSAGEGVLRV